MYIHFLSTYHAAPFEGFLYVCFMFKPGTPILKIGEQAMALVALHNAIHKNSSASEQAQKSGDVCISSSGGHC